ncbi:MAG TPA: class I SAM-dependent methyltransferase [Cyclobacteriaceae bacterium]|nr:class I SAM-dependent methyltransferase [Cyclobacteriaceae bacterium]
MKDYFSGHAKNYATFRPTYPDELYAFILEHVAHKRYAWDCGTGNGQVAGRLAAHFEYVEASDISQKQIEQAPQVENIRYHVSPAEATPFPDNRFDLITVAQALHWFDLEKFYDEVKRVATDGAVIAVWGYGLNTVNPAIDNLMLDFYSNTTGPYWDPARRLVETRYEELPFPFGTIPFPGFNIKVEWNLHDYIGYLRTWSATQAYIRATAVDPTVDLFEQMKKFWEPQIPKTVTFPVFGRMGRVGDVRPT